MRIALSALFLLAGAGVASAQANLSVTLTPGSLDNVQSLSYACGEGQSAMPVQYVNAGANALAILPIDGEQRIFVNVVSGSGAKYVSGAHVWWTKGDSATLENEMEEGSSIECSVTDAQSAQ